MFNKLAALAIILAVCAHAADNPSALDKPTLEAYVRHLFLWGPQIEVTITDPEPSELPGLLQARVRASARGATQEEVFYISKDGQKIARASVYDIKENPFHKELSVLNLESQPSLGTPGAPVVLVLFTDFQCSYCKKEAEILRENLIAAYPEQVRMYFKDFPLEQIHPWSKMAAIAGRCVYNQSPEAFWDFHDWIFAHQTEIDVATLKSKVLEFASNNGGVDGLLLGRCIDTRATEAEVDASLAEARELKLNSTPTLFINGRRISAQLPWESLKQIIDFELDYQKTAQNAGDTACCEVKLPTPLSQ